MPIEFWIANLKSDEAQFSVPCAVGTWVFNRHDDYDDLIKKLEEGQCARTYYATNDAVTRSVSDDDFDAALDGLIDASLILSFLTASCVTPVDTTMGSEVSFVQLGDSFIRARAISGFPSLQIGQPLNTYFSRGMSALAANFTSRKMRLFLSHWISGLTCFSMEDLFLSIGVQMDIVKQCEISETGRYLHYFDGMVSASNRYGLPQLSRDYNKMRNDIVHEGVLSGANFSGKNKEECAKVIAESLNWIDLYISAVLSLSASLTGRWRGQDLQFGLPSLSLRE